ncbi:MAG: hypothetical protein WKH64_04265 [Chloroflexia bacterium]
MEEIRPSEDIRRINECVSARKVYVERRELLPGQARDDPDAQRPAGSALQFLGDLAELEGEVVDVGGCRHRLAQAVQRGSRG